MTESILVSIHVRDNDMNESGHATQEVTLDREMDMVVTFQQIHQVVEQCARAAIWGEPFLEGVSS